MNKKYLVTALAILPLLIFHSLTYAGTFTAFEPKTFVRGSGTPVAETTSFSIKNPNTTYTMHIYNGGYDSEYSSVSSAVITLNGTAIFTTSDFNQKVAHLQKEITLSIYNNLQVDLRSSPASAVTIIIEGVDNTPPLIDISLPVNNSYLNAPSITVTGNADDAISWISQVTVNGAIAPISNGTYSLPVNLIEGINSIIVTATDAGGNTSSTNISVILDTIQPSIILNPVPSFTNNPQLVISGTVTDASPLTSFTINGTPVTVTSNAFSAMLNLLEGDNTLIISATDMAGNIGTATSKIFLDTIPPSVVISSPSNGTYLNTPSITVTGAATDAQSGISSVRINGVISTISGNTYTASNVQLTEGLNTVTVVVEDMAGNTGSQQIEVFLDTTAPTGSILVNNGAAYANTAAVTLTFSCNDYVSSCSQLQLSNDNTNWSTHEAYATNKMWTLPSGDGTKTVYAKFSDKTGNWSYTYSATIILDKTPPAITITSPADGSNVTTNTITLTGTIDDNTASVSVNGIRATVARNTFTVEGINLIEGRNSIAVTASDSAGNTAAVTITITYTSTSQAPGPAINIQYPLNGSTASYPSTSVWGTVDDSATSFTINSNVVSIIYCIPGGRQVCTNQAYFSGFINLSAGANTMTVIATTNDGRSSTASVTVYYYNADTTAPLISITSPANGATVNTATISVTGTIDDNAATVTVNGINAAVSNNTFTAAGITLIKGANIIAVSATDSIGNNSSASITITYALPGLPDPATVAPPIDNTVATTLAAATAFLYSGENPIQTGVAPGTIEAKRAAVLRGKVTANDGTSLSGVKITILGHTEYGSTKTREDGIFDMAVNGGGWITVNYEKSGYLPVQRKVDAPWQDYAWLPEIVMLPFDAKVTTIDLSSNTPIQVAQGNPVTDADGTRTATILFPSGNGATMLLPDGTWMPLTNINVRATEYTVGDNGPKGMPGALPPTSGYTYAVEYSLDEAVMMGAKYVSFSKPVISYTDNFLNFPVGGIVPVGYYDRENGVWIPLDDGKIIKILGVTNGLASLDINGSNTPAASADLTAMGITDAERETLAALYQPGQSLWRVSVSHFSPYDYNWAIGLPNGATGPGQPEGFAGNPQPPGGNTTQCSSIIGCESQTLGESIDITGTPFSLLYQSDRTPGSAASRTIEIPLSGSSTPSSLKRIDMEVSVAGQKFSQSFNPATNLTYTFTWDGKDAYGRTMQGAQDVTIRIGNVYDLSYSGPASGCPANKSFACVGTSSAPPVGKSGRAEYIIWQEQKMSIGYWNAITQGFGAWTLSAHHAYDTQGKTLYLGDGSQRNAEDIGKIITTVAGKGNWSYSGDGGPATGASLSYPYSVAVDAQGSLFIADYYNHRIRKVAPDGIITTVVGTGTYGYSGDGGPATSASLYRPIAVAVDAQGSLFIADSYNHRIRKVAPDGIITTVVGTGTYGYSGDGGPATSASLKYPYGVAVDAQGSLFIADSYNHRIRKVAPDGIITTVVGTGTYGYSGDGGPATSASLKYPSGVTVDSQGNLYISDYGNSRIRKVSPDGIITTVAGNGGFNYSGDGGPATSGSLKYPFGVAVDSQGNLFIADTENSRIRKVTPDGIITTVAGNGTLGYSGDAGPATSGSLKYPSGVAVDSQGNLFIADFYDNRARKVGLPLPGFSDSDIAIPSEDGRELYGFDTYGKHLRTVDAITGATKYTFTYNTAGYLTSITDRDGNITSIERDGSNNATAIITSGGQRTNLTLDANSYLATITNPNNETHQMTYTSDGLLTTFTNPKGNTSTFDYDSSGRLIKDTNATGGYKALTRTENSSSKYTVNLSTALGRTDTYTVENLSTGDTKRTGTDPSGLTTTTQINTNGTTTTTSPDGTITTKTEGADPRFKMQSPVTTALTIKAPSGLTYTMSGSRTASFSDSTNLLSLTNATDTVTVNSKSYTRAYSAATKTITSITPVGRKSYTTLDSLGRISSEQFDSLNAVNYSYDTQGRLITVASGQGSVDSRTSSISYDSLNQISSITDAANRTVSFTDDLAGRVTQQTLPDSRVIAYNYDANGNVTSITPPGRPSHSFTYDLRDLETYYNPPDVGIGAVNTQYAYNLDKQLTLITRPDGQTISFQYDNGGRLSTIAIPTGNISYAYNATTGNLSSVTAPGETLSYNFDGSLLTGTSWTGSISGSVGFSYNNDFLVTSESVNGANAVSYAYDNDGLLTGAGSLSISRNSQNGLITGSTLGSVSDSFAYSSFGEPSRYTASVSGSTLLDVQYTRDNLGRITSKTETINGATATYAYTYDQAGRLTDVGKNGTTASHYDYDTNGNRVGWAVPTGSGVATYDNQDRFVSYGSATFSYTANGELQSKTTSGQTTTYNYDVLGNLKSATLADGTVIEYLVDGQNRRIDKKVNGVLVQGFLYKDQLKPIAELDGTANVVSRFVYGNKPNVPEYMVKGGITYRIITDHLGSPRLVVNSSTGAIAQQLDYDEFGNVINDTNPGFQPFGFAGGIYDQQTKLVRFGVRDYDAEMSKWTTSDPIKFDGGLTNHYEYVGDPVNRIDPLGLYWFPIITRGGGKGILSSGPGAMTGGIIGAYTGAAIGAATGVPGMPVVGGMAVGWIGTHIGGYFDPPCAGQLNCNEPMLYEPPKPIEPIKCH